MSDDNLFIPNILLCGDTAEFLARVQQRPFKIVGQINFVGNTEGQEFNFFKDERLAINGKIYNLNVLLKLLNDGEVNFIVFNSFKEYGLLLRFLIQGGLAPSEILTVDQLNALPSDNFYDFDADNQLLMILKVRNIKTLLDFDGHFAKGQVMTKGDNDLTEIDCIFEKSTLPFQENIYSHIYKRFSNCCLKHYDAILIEERILVDFRSIFFSIENSSEVIITFARYNSELYNHIHKNFGNFSKVEVYKSFAGEWLFCYPNKPSENFAMYVITHKELPPEYIAKFPEGYKVIHAGRELSRDMGYIGDNTGDNISYLNPYINEITALYWMWKNTSHTVIGLSHYRRFFTESIDNKFAPEKILTKTATKELLKHYDLILVPQYVSLIQFENIANTCGIDLSKTVRQIITKNIERFQPEYLDTFNLVMNNKNFYKCKMFVTRRNVFDVYCSWLFSFFIDSVKETINFLPLIQVQGNAKRVLGYFAECMLTVFVMKNNLRIKELEIIGVNEL